MIATLIYIGSVLIGLLALAIGIVAVLVGSLGAVLANAESASIELPLRATAFSAAAVGFLIFIGAATFLCSLMAAS